MSENDELFNFPCEFPIKVMGRLSEGFASTVVGIVKKHISEQSGMAVDSKLSSGEKYLSMTVTITAESRGQLDAIYGELKGFEEVLMLL